MALTQEQQKLIQEIESNRSFMFALLRALDLDEVNDRLDDLEDVQRRRTKSSLNNNP